MEAVCERGAHCEKKRGGYWADSKWQKGSRLREDGEQWTGRLAGTLGGAFEGALGPLPHGRGFCTIACSLSDHQHTERFLRKTRLHERGKESTTPVSVVPACFTLLLCFSAHVFLPSLRGFCYKVPHSTLVSFLLSVPVFPEDLRHRFCFCIPRCYTFLSCANNTVQARN